MSDFAHINSEKIPQKALEIFSGTVNSVLVGLAYRDRYNIERIRTTLPHTIHNIRRVSNIL